jgi:RNA polymerase sigma-70 factor, ECF subfamily
MTDAGTEANSFSELLNHHREQVVRVACRLLNGDRSSAEDVAQEVFLRLWNASERYTEQRTFRAYLLTITCRLCTDYRRRNRPTVSLSDCWHLADEKAVPEVSSLTDAVPTAIATLPEEQRVVFVLSHYEGLRYREIAEIVGCPIGTVASRKFLAVQTLREHLRPYLDTTEGDAP